MNLESIITGLIDSRQEARLDAIDRLIQQYRHEAGGASKIPLGHVNQLLQILLERLLDGGWRLGKLIIEFLRDFLPTLGLGASKFFRVVLPGLVHCFGNSRTAMVATDLLQRCLLIK